MERSIGVMQTRMRDLIDQELYSSAEKLGSFLLCASRYGDALYGQGEYRRALNFYKQSLQRRKVGPHSRPPQTPTSSPSSPGYGAIQTEEEAAVKHKEALCYEKLHEVPDAIHSLEAIPIPLRTLPIHLKLGKLYMATGRGSRTNAVRAFTEALAMNPMAVEAIEPLVAMDVSKEEVLRYTAERVSEDEAWLAHYVEGLYGMHVHDTMGAMHHWNVLAEAFPHNLPSLLNLGKLHLDAEQLDEAWFYLNKARVTDTHNLHHMDYFALLLKKKGAKGELNRLAHDLIHISKHRTEPWVAVALHADLNEEPEKALGFLRCAAEIEPQNSLVNELQGCVHLAMNKPEEALLPLFKAKEAKRSLRVYRGLVDAYMMGRKLKDAYTVADEATQRLPGNAGALTLKGRVLASPMNQSGDKERAKEYYFKALKLDPHCIDATLALSELYQASRQYEQCVELLERSLNEQNQDVLHIKLANVLTMTGKHGEALSHYHTAMSLNPTSTAAQEGYQRLEKLLRGADPDDDDGEMDADVDHSGSLEGSHYI